jgi:hypothetical protein
MMLATLIDRIQRGKANNLIYASDGKEGLVSVWKHDGMIILTWEECSAGEQYNEHLYTRDERHSFPTVDELVSFLSEHGLKPESFTP